MTELNLIYEFMKTGLFAIGGGLATIPFLKSIAERYDWYSSEQLTDIIAVAESTPGPIGVNAATYAGIEAAGLAGGIIATLALVFPSVVVILIISRFLAKFRNSRMVNNVFYGLRPASIGLISAAMFPVLLSSIVNLTNMKINPAAAIAYVCFSAICFFNSRLKKPLHPILFIAAGAVFGMICGDYLEI